MNDKRYDKAQYEARDSAITGDFIGCGFFAASLFVGLASLGAFILIPSVAWLVFISASLLSLAVGLFVMPRMRATQMEGYKEELITSFEKRYVLASNITGQECVCSNCNQPMMVDSDAGYLDFDPKTGTYAVKFDTRCARIFTGESTPEKCDRYYLRVHHISAGDIWEVEHKDQVQSIDLSVLNGQ